MSNIWPYSSVSIFCKDKIILNQLTKSLKLFCILGVDDDKCDSCSDILEELENIDDDTDKHGIQFVKSNDVKLAHEIGIFAFPALVYYETGVPIMYDGKYWGLILTVKKTK